ncbi:MAG TPA: radical SAM protein [Candidatus Nitrosotenuis sp.]|nr:radical SAM protein [Candidatus Nitrosotenuis sp.]
MLELKAPIYVELMLRDTQGGLNAARWGEIIARLGEFVNEFRLTGHEPAEHPELFDILEALEKTKKFYHLYTSGAWSDPESLLVGIRKLSYFGSFVFELPAVTPELYQEIQGFDGYKQMVSNLQKAAASGFEINTRTWILAQNAARVTEIAETAFQMGAHYALFYRWIGPPDHPSNPGEDLLLEALGRIHELRQLGYNVSLGNCVPNCFHLSDSYGCMGGITFAAVNPQGQLLPCPCSKTVGGDLVRQGVVEAWTSRPMRAWRRDRLPKECLKCSRLSYCPGGCRAAAEHSGGSKDPLIRGPIQKEEPALLEVSLDEELCPVPRYTVREENFGWVLVRANQVIPVSRKAGSVLKTFDGRTDLGKIEQRFGPAAVSFIYSLYVRGFVDLRLPARN